MSASLGKATAISLEHPDPSMFQAGPLCPQLAPLHTTWVASLPHHHDIRQLPGAFDSTTTSPHSAIPSCALPDASPCTRYTGKQDTQDLRLWCQGGGFAPEPEQQAGSCWPCIASWLLLHTAGTAHCSPDQSEPTTLLLVQPQKDLLREPCVIPGSSEAVVPPATPKRVHQAGYNPPQVLSPHHLLPHTYSGRSL